MSKKVLVVVGATGRQGASVVDAVLENARLNKEYSIRGTTRDLASTKAEALEKKGVEVVEADFHDVTSFKKAFVGAHVVFANTVTIYDGNTYQHEVEHGRALANAAVAAGVPFYIYSTLPNAGRNSGGKLKNMGHFDGKEEVEQYVRTLPMKSAFVALGSYMSNFHESMAPRPLGNDIYGFASFVRPETQMPMIAAAADVGKWVAAILTDFPEYEAKVLCCAIKLYTMKELADIMTKVSGKTIIYKQLPEDVWRGFLPPLMAAHLADMLRYFQDYGYYGADTEEKVVWSAEQALGKLTTFEEYLQANPLSLE